MVSAGFYGILLAPAGGASPFSLTDAQGMSHAQGIYPLMVPVLGKSRRHTISTPFVHVPDVENPELYSFLSLI